MTITARALTLELLVARAPRPVPVRDLVAAGRLFDLAENALRVTLARLGADGLVSSPSRGAYALAPLAEPLAREVAAWRGAEGRLRRWDGRYVAVHTGALGRTDRAALRRRERALSLLGFAELAKGLSLRPDNLRDGVAGVRERLLSLGVEPGALVASLGDLAPADAAGAAELWDGTALVAGYRRTRLEIERWLGRASRLSLEVAARESFVLGRRAIRE
ncbi:MAG: PaaX family transcriptional regulator, partial [Deltaproteobacteria bacterium]|nr:PaaX family transcriptional regulator [Deltaproteobacteria bacterium]